MKLSNPPQLHRLPNGTYFPVDRDVRLSSKRLKDMLIQSHCIRLTLHRCTKIHLRDSVKDKDII